MGAAEIPPAQFFKAGENEGKYSQYDSRGVPTHSADGAELPKSALKKLEKIYAGHVKKYAKASDKTENGVSTSSATAAEKAPSKDSVEAELPPVPEGACLPDIRHGTFGGRQGFEMVSAGPLTHMFVL